jgi:hypothetical protein
MSKNKSFSLFSYVVPVLTFTVILNIPKFFESKFIWESEVTAPPSTTPTTNSSSGNHLDNEASNVTIVTLGVSDLRSDPDYIRFYINWTRLITTGKKERKRSMHKRGRLSSFNKISSMKRLWASQKKYIFSQYHKFR